MRGLIQLVPRSIPLALAGCSLTLKSCFLLDFFPLTSLFPFLQCVPYCNALTCVCASGVSVQADFSSLFFVFPLLPPKWLYCGLPRLYLNLKSPHCLTGMKTPLTHLFMLLSVYPLSLLFSKSLRLELKRGGAVHRLRRRFATVASYKQTVHDHPKCVCVLSWCLCEKMFSRPPLRRHCCVFFCLEPTGRSLKSSLSCATNTLAATVGQQQDVFPERKRGWEEGPNVDLFLLLSFPLRLSRSCRPVCRKVYFSQHFDVSCFSFCRVGFLWPYIARLWTPLHIFLHLASIPPPYSRAPKDLGYFLLPNFNKRPTSVSANARRRRVGTQIETRWL